MNGSADAIELDPDFDAGGGTPYSGRPMPICDSKLVTVVGGHSNPAGFYMYTDVPLPAKFYGLVNDDLNVQTDRRSIMLGEVAGQANGPVGIYDENGNWKYTAHSDPNGFYEVLLPSTGTYNCPLPAGPCAGVYRLVGNDPGTLSHRNTDYNPQFRTIATEFQAWPGVVHPVDQAPTHIGITIEGPAAQFGALSLCKVNQPDTAAVLKTPEFFSIDRPFYDPSAANESTHPFTIKGTGFGTSGTLRMGNSTITTQSWSDSQITFLGSAVSGLSQAPHQLSITNGQSALSTVNALTFHRLSLTNSGGYLLRNDVYEVSGAFATDSGRNFSPMHDAWDSATNSPAGYSGFDIRTTDPQNPVPGSAVTGGRAIQRAVEAARQSQNGNNPRAKMVVIYPNTASNYAPHNAFGAYFENVILHSKIRLQGVGPGGARSNIDIVDGSAIDASTFWAATQVVPPGGNQDTSDGSYSDDWRTFAATFNNALGDPEAPQTRAGTGPAELPEGEGILAIAESQGQWGGNSAPSAAFRPGVDGLLLTGGDQQGNPGNINTVPGAAGNPEGNGAPINPGPSQGGAIMLDQYVRDFQLTNNQIQSNGGSYAAIRIGTPDLPDNGGDNNNDRLRIANNRIVANGGTNLAGALGLFAGADNYVVTANDFCGNFSAEYGGAISHYGRSNSGQITKNRIYYNQSYDEGGGIMIGGALPINNDELSPGAGSVTIDSNTLVSNQANDDGGGIRFLMAGNFAQMVSNNIIANNLSTHEGGGIALDDSTDVSVVNDTIVKNITSATAATNGAVGNIKQANPAGLSTGGNSAQLQACDAALPSSTHTGGRTTSGSTTYQLINSAAGGSNLITQADVGATLVSANVPAGAQILSVANNGRSAVLSVAATGTSSTSSPGLLFSIYRECFGQPPRPAGSPNWSRPKMLNNIFADNRAGWAQLPTFDNFNTTALRAIGQPGDEATAIQRWDIGVSNSAGLTPSPSGPTGFAGSSSNNTTNAHSVLSNAGGGYSFTATGADNLNPVNDGTDGLAFVNAQDFLVDSLMWRTNFNASYPILVAHYVPITLLADYHLTNASPNPQAFNGGAASGGGTAVPSIPTGGPHDVDFDARPLLGGIDRGADEFPGALANLSITKTNGVTTVHPGDAVSYSIVVSNAGPSAVAAAPVTDSVPASLTGVTWSCAGAGCTTALGSGSINTTVNLGVGGSVTFTLNGTVAANATGSLANSAAVGMPVNVTDPNPANNSATDSDPILLRTDLSITKTDSQTLVNRGAQIRYVIVVSNTGPNPVTGATVSDTFSSPLSGTINWTCTTTGGATCGVGGGNGSGNINRTVNMPVGSTITFATTSGSVSSSTTSPTLTNTATVTAPASIDDTNPLNNSATDTTTIQGVHVGDLDWTSTNTSATQWSATVTITVHNANHSPVSGVTVLGAWPLLQGIGSCTTNASGQCSLTRTGRSIANEASVTFAVLILNPPANGYQFTLNHDPDSGAQASTGTTITAQRP